MQDPESERPARKRDAIGSCHHTCLNCRSISNPVHCLLLLACTVILVLAPTILSECLCRHAVMVARPAPSQQVCWKPFERSKESWSREILKPHHSCLQHDTQYEIPQPDCTIESPCKFEPSSLNNVTDMTNCRTCSDCNSGPITVLSPLRLQNNDSPTQRWEATQSFETKPSITPQQHTPKENHLTQTLPTRHNISRHGITMWTSRIKDANGQQREVCQPDSQRCGSPG